MDTYLTDSLIKIEKGLNKVLYELSQITEENLDDKMNIIQEETRIVFSLRDELKQKYPEDLLKKNNKYFENTINKINTMFDSTLIKLKDSQKKVAEELSALQNKKKLFLYR